MGDAVAAGNGFRGIGPATVKKNSPGVAWAKPGYGLQVSIVTPRSCRRSAC